jgi:predicted nucleotidyltransferase
VSAVPPFDAQLEALIGCLTACAPIEQIILFGSRARGDFEELSDYDLLVIVPDSGYLNGLALKLRRSADRVAVAKDLVVASHSIMDSQSTIPGTIYYEAAQAGLTVYVAA